MGTIGDCCCCNLLQEDLDSIPDWTIYGYTPETDWQLLPVESNNPCCIGKNYSVDAGTPFTEVYSDLLARSYIRETGQIEVRAMSTRTRFSQTCCNFNNPTPVVECDEDVGQAYYVDFENINEIEVRARMRYRLEDIEVRIGQHVTPCGELEGQRVYTVTVRFTWRVQVAYQQKTYSKRAWDATVVHPCMSQTIPDNNSETLIDWPAGTGSNFYDATIESFWAQQFEELPEDFQINSHSSPITPEYFDECIEMVAGCYIDRTPRTPECVDVYYELDHEIPLLELEARERCVPLGYGECCYPWNQLVRQSGYTGTFGIAPIFPNASGTGYGMVFVVPVVRTGACCDPCPPNSSSFTNNEKAIVFGQHSMVSYNIESEFFETTPAYAIPFCVPNVVRDLTS